MFVYVVNGYYYNEHDICEVYAVYEEALKRKEEIMQMPKMRVAIYQKQIIKNMLEG